jgi:hypothetical protein
MHTSTVRNGNAVSTVSARAEINPEKTTEDYRRFATPKAFD